MIRVKNPIQRSSQLWIWWSMSKIKMEVIPSASETLEILGIPSKSRCGRFGGGKHGRIGYGWGLLPAIGHGWRPFVADTAPFKGRFADSVSAGPFPDWSRFSSCTPPRLQRAHFCHALRSTSLHRHGLSIAYRLGFLYIARLYLHYHHCLNLHFSTFKLVLRHVSEHVYNFLENHGTILKFAREWTPEPRNETSFWKWVPPRPVRFVGEGRRGLRLLDVFEELFWES